MNVNIFFKVGNNGASLLEVMIAMVILAVGFLGVMALSTSLFQGNTEATNMNIATEIAQSEASQLNCLGVSGITGNFTSPAYYPDATYYVYPTIQSPDTRDPVTTCINPVLAAGGPVPASLPSSGGLGITTGYVVKIFFSTNPNNSSLLDALVRVSWNNGQQAVTFYDVVA
ncbi:MAG: prepilin-type N-terminal cleavage/methylation domain-containing protein [Deltaproteobacteria bacterium]|nr:prepilin-type N-terminal cleavage/methylation domain-containing protein [Deltaproteobacteria bacterium]